jgi:hypothetical protein
VVYILIRLNIITVEEYKINRIKTSIDNLCIVYLSYMCGYQPEKAIDVYNDIVEFYLKFKSKGYTEVTEYTKYKLDWLLQDKRTDFYYLPILTNIYNKINR